MKQFCIDTFLIKSSACSQSLRDSRSDTAPMPYIYMIPQVACKMGLLIFSVCVCCAWPGGERRNGKTFLGQTWWLFTPDTGRGGGDFAKPTLLHRCYSLISLVEIITYITDIVFLCVRHNRHAESITCTDKYFATDLFVRADFDKSSRLLQICVLPLIFAVLMRNHKKATTKPWCIKRSRALHVGALIEYLNLYYLIFILLFASPTPYGTSGLLLVKSTTWPVTARWPVIYFTAQAK